MTETGSSAPVAISCITKSTRIIVGCLVTYEHQVMLCRRAIEPRSGLWTLPAGFMENGETAEAGALRETWEEARAKPTLGHLHTIYSIPHINQVYMLYHAVLETAEFAPGPESLDVSFSRWTPFLGRIWPFIQ